MPPFSFVPMDEHGMQILSSWFADPLLKRWYQPPTQQWFEYVRHAPGVFAWMVYENDAPVGHIQMDIQEGMGFIGFLVNPELLRRGIGKRMLTEFLNLPEAKSAGRIIAEVEEENVASIRCLLSVGFTHDTVVSKDPGFIRFFIQLGSPSIIEKGIAI
jgi:RimJ/RimL family protein N-acetyltransferase